MPQRIIDELKELDEISRSFAENTDLRDVLAVWARAEAARQYSRSNSLGQPIQNHAVELRLRTERRIGKMLKGLIKRGGDQKTPLHNEHLMLADIGVDHNQSARWQQEAMVPDDLFEEYIATAKNNGVAITAKGLLQLAKTIVQQQQNREP